MLAALGLLLVSPALAAPCDLYAAGGTPCVAAHSTVRSLYSGYQGRLYQLMRTSDNATLDIAASLAGGFPNATLHDAFCAASGEQAVVVAAPPLLPPLNSVVTLAPASPASYALRHCYSQAFITTTSTSGADHDFRLVAALSGTPDAVSFESLNYPGNYLAPVATAEPGRLGIVPSPAALDASWTAQAANGGAVTLLTLSPAFSGAGMAVGSNLTGICAHSYTPPAASVYLTQQPTPWVIATDGPPPQAACVISKIYDQSGNGNHLLPATPAINNHDYDHAVNATRHPLTVGGHRVYGAYFEGGMGYRAQNTTGVALGNDPESIYLVAGGKHVNSGCCYDYGNSENLPNDPSSFCDGCMEAAYVGTAGGWCDADGSDGPWIKADLEKCVALLTFPLLTLHSVLSSLSHHPCFPLSISHPHQWPVVLCHPRGAQPQQHSPAL